MTRLSRILTAVAALSLAGMYFLPLWKVELVAPQYPEGIGMYIAISDIRGFSEFDLGKINNLNHYIGMQEIVPASIPELRWMPWILAGLIALGLAAAAIGRRRLLHAWIAVLLIAGGLGLADFYRWGHDYGHNLDPNAIIKVPGMTYQPPVIGRKQLLNFTAESWPASGGLLGALAFALAVGAAFVTRGSRSPHGRGTPATAALVFAACAAAGPQPIGYDGTETCSYCSMLITDSRFGAEVVTNEGKVHKFDSVECLAGYALQPHTESQIASMWVTDYSRPGVLIDATTARFVRVTEGTGSPMGLGIRAFSAETAPADAMNWTSVLELAGSNPPAGASAR